MQDTKLRNFQCSDTNKLKMHMKNKKRHKTCKCKDQTRRLTKNNLKIMKNTMNAWIFSKNARWICNWHQTYNMTQDSNKKHKKYFWIFYDFMIFFVFSFNFFLKIILKKKNKDSKIFNMNSRNLMLFSLKLQSKGQAWLNSQPSFSKNMSIIHSILSQNLCPKEFRHGFTASQASTCFMKH